MHISSIINKISRRLAQESGFTGDAGQDEEVFSYAIIILLLNATALGMIMLLAWLLSTLKVSLVIWTAFFSLRIFAGGRHQSRPVTCWITTVIVFTTLSYLITVTAPKIDFNTHLLTAPGLMFALLATIFYAPVTIASKQFTREKRRKLKTTATVVMVFWTTIVLAPIQAFTAETALPLGITAGLVMQAFSIMPIQLRRNERCTCQ